MAGKGLAELLAGGEVPETDRLVGASGGKELAVRAEGHRVDGPGMAGEGLAERLAGGEVPETNRTTMPSAKTAGSGRVTSAKGSLRLKRGRRSPRTKRGGVAHSARS